MVADRVLRVSESENDELRQGIAKIQAEQHLDTEFPSEVEEAAEHAAARPTMPELDRTDIELVTIDPASAMDLDQAMHIERDGDGYVVHYAIADLAAFVEPGDPVDVEANRRGVTLYGADTKLPLHPKVLSEGAASLLPDEDRPSLLWTIRLDKDGEGTDVKLERARVRSRAKLDYEGVQKQLDGGAAGDIGVLLKAVGELRLAKEAERGGVSLPMPEQEVDVENDVWKLEFRQMLPVESWNAQISLLTGFAAASMMVYARVGILRTLPPPAPDAVKRLHRAAKALHIDWPAEELYPDFVRSLDASKPNHAAMISACTSLLRGAGYVGFDGAVPAQPEHAALASEYAHVTAPLRRLVDRYGLEVCVALSAGTSVPSWVLEKLDELPKTMQQADRRSHQYENAVLDLVEAETLKARVGERFAGVVLELAADDPHEGRVMISEPAVEANVAGAEPLPVGEEVDLTLAEADPATRVVRFTL
ncbi:MAG: RNB domain-containing ribonuclease [Actinomycetota bacterium]|nr:RNB domain-containing ribonuclease [Actinomycetota bacterium]